MQTAARSRHGFVRLADIAQARPGHVTITVHIGDRHAVCMGTRKDDSVDWRWLKRLRNGRLVSAPPPKRTFRRKNQEAA